MSSEDDTFNALKKWSFERIDDAWNNPFEQWAGNWGSILEKAGWTNNEFWHKRTEMQIRSRDIRRSS